MIQFRPYKVNNPPQICTTRFNPTQMNVSSFQKSDMIKEKRLPNIAFKGNYMIGPDNNEKNHIWTKKFDEAFENNDAEAFLDFVNNKTRLKPIFTPESSSNEGFSIKKIFTPFLDENSENTPSEITITKDPTNKDFPVINMSIDARNQVDNIKITASKTGHIQIENSLMGNLFVERDAFDNDKMKETDKDIIADGARGFDPFDQTDWPKVIGKTWPTAENTRSPYGVAKLSLDNSQKAILLDTNDSITDSYGTKPRAMAILDKENNSVIMAFQQENFNPEIDFAAWSILPFKIREGKKTVAIFPADKKAIKNYKDSKNNDLNEIRNSAQWNLDEDKFFVVDVSKPSEKTEYEDPYADWCLFATQGEDTACLVRSCYKDNSDNKQFKVFSGQEDLGGTKYFELEFMAPKVKQGQKSTLVYRLEFVSLKNLGLEPLNTENSETQIKEIGKNIQNKINWSKTIASFTFADN